MIFWQEPTLEVLRAKYAKYLESDKWGADYHWLGLHSPVSADPLLQRV